MAVQEDNLPVSKLMLTAVLAIVFTVLCVLCGQVLYLAVQDVENEAKIDESVPYEINVVRRDQLNALNEYVVTDKAQRKISIPIDDAMSLVLKEERAAGN